MAKKYQPRDAKALTGVVVVWVWIVMAAIGCEIAALVAEVASLSGLPSDLDVLAAMPTQVALLAVLIGLLALIKLGAILIAGIFSLKWVYRTDANAHAIAKGLTVSPPWAVGSFFVPILSLFRPYTAVREIWQASTQPQGWRKLSDPPILRWWWGLFLLGGVAGYISGFLAPGGHHATAGGLNAQYAVLLTADALHLVTAFLFMSIVRQIGERQVAALAAHTMGPEEDEAAIPAWAP